MRWWSATWAIRASCRVRTRRRCRRFLFIITKDSRDHSPEVYQEVILPAFAAMRPAPRTHLTHLGAGVHAFWKAEEGLPQGVAPAAIKLWNDAITGGYFEVRR